ncbi:MAG: hypothetical protein HDT40_01220 [Lachnospiraceae bacterium]|nr:hypothetical protein [Lachnospiraceae bacterium]
MTFEWDCQAAMAASERLKAMAEDTSCEADICEGTGIPNVVENAEVYSQEFSDMLNKYAEALYADGTNLEKKTVYINIMDDDIGRNLTLTS